MSCRKTYPLYNKRGRFIGMSSCGECPYCRLKRSSELSFYSYCASMDSYRSGLSNYFYTLTYTDHHLPVNRDTGVPSVSFHDLYLFKHSFFRTWKKHFDNIKPKVLATTEYGGMTNRPHIHFILFGVPDKYTSEVVYDSWHNKGEIDFGVLQAGGSYYLTKYCSTTPTRADQKIMYDDNLIERPKLVHSPFSDSRTLKEIIATSLDNNLCHNINGYPSPLPGYVRRKIDPFNVMFDKYKYLKDFQKRLKLLGMTETEYSDMLYRRYLVRCHKQGIPVTDDRHRRESFHAFQKAPPSTLASSKSALDVLNYYASAQKNLVVAGEKL